MPNQSLSNINSSNCLIFVVITKIGMKESDKNIPIAVAKEITIKQTEQVIKKSKLKKVLYGIAGFASLVLAILGIVVPGLPCTPFALLSAAMFAKSSDKLYNKLLNSKILGARIRDYQKRKGISKGGKVKVIILMWTMVLISSLLVIKATTFRIIILSAGAVGAIVVWFFVPEGKKDAPKTKD